MYPATPPRHRVPPFLALLILVATLPLSPLTARAGLFDDLVDKARESAEQGLKGVFEGSGSDADKDAPPAGAPAPAPAGVKPAPSAAPQPSTAPTPAPPMAVNPASNRELVRQIQEALNARGFDAGPPDGLYGPGTRSAIQAFQRSEGLDDDGRPSDALLTRLREGTQVQPTAVQPAPAGPSASSAAGLPEPTPGGLMLAAVHYRPYLLDNENMLKRVLLAVHPEERPVLSNEFEWHRRKDQFKKRLLDEARTAPLEFEVQPWRDSTVADALQVELMDYDFDRNAFRVRFATGTARQVLVGMLMTSTAKPAPKYPQDIPWFAMPPDSAEKLASYFGHGTRGRVFLHYRLKAVGAAVSSQPVPIVEFVGDRLDLYAKESTPQGNAMHTEFRQLATVPIPHTDEPSVPRQAVQTVSGGGPTDVVRNTEIDGVRLGMRVEDALAALASHGFEMEQPSADSKLTGITIEGRGTTADGAGWARVMLRHKNGTVYQFNEVVDYYRLPPDTTVAQLQQRYRKAYLESLSGARYSHEENSGLIHVDDESPPPYARKITSPHARVLFGGGRGKFRASIDLEWKAPVGVSW